MISQRIGPRMLSSAVVPCAAVWWTVAVCGAVWCIIHCVPINQAACCPSSSSSRAKPLSAINLHQTSQNTERQTKEQRGTKVQRARYWREAWRCLITHTDTHTPHNIPWLHWTIRGIMRGRWSAILIRSLFAFLIVTSMCCRSVACFVYSGEGEKTANLFDFLEDPTTQKRALWVNYSGDG